MVAMLPVGLAYLLFNSNVPQFVAILLGLMTVIFIGLAITATLLIFSKSIRSELLRFTGRIWQRIFKRDVITNLDELNDQFSQGVSTLKGHPVSAGIVLLLTFVDWVASVIVLGYCFDAFGPPLDPGAVVAIFVLGIMAGVISAIPGGIGVQEGSMTGVAMLLGATFEQAILAAMLFRVIYYFIPYFISPLFYWRLLRQPALAR